MYNRKENIGESGTPFIVNSINRTVDNALYASGGKVHGNMFALRGSIPTGDAFTTRCRPKCLIYIAFALTLLNGSFVW